MMCYLHVAAPPAPQAAGVMNNGSRDVSRDIQKLQQQLQDIKDQVIHGGVGTDSTLEWHIYLERMVDFPI